MRLLIRDVGDGGRAFGSAPVQLNGPALPIERRTDLELAIDAGADAQPSDVGPVLPSGDFAIED